MSEYYNFLAVNLMRHRDTEFWLFTRSGSKRPGSL